MQYRKIGKLKKNVSKIIFGTGIDLMCKGSSCNGLLDAAFEKGITTFDTARVYNLSEKSLGDWIDKRENREEVVIVSKCGHPLKKENRLTSKEIILDIENSCKDLKTNYIDILLLHKDHHNAQIDEIIEILNDLYEKGKIYSFGASNWSISRINEANEYAYKHNLQTFSVSSPNFCLAKLNRDPWGGSVSISVLNRQEEIKWYKENKMPIFAYSSLGSGFLSGKLRYSQISNISSILDDRVVYSYASDENFERLRRLEIMAQKKSCTYSQLALAWLLNQETEVHTITATSSIHNLRENLRALDIFLTEKEILYLDLISNNY